MTTIDEPMLDGMPEIPPAWVRPDRGVRIAALALGHMLAAALPHVGTDDDIPVLQSIRLQVVDGALITRATDRFTLIREIRPVAQTCDDFEFLLRADDASSLRVLLRAVLRGLADEQKDVEPVDLALEITDTGPTLRVLGQDLDVRFTEHEYDGYPNTESILDRALERIGNGEIEPFDAYINPSLLARLVPLQKAGRSSGLFLFRRPAVPSPVIVTTLDEDDDVVVALMPINTTDAAGAA